MKALRFAASLALVAAIVAVYRLLPVNNTTVALTLLLAILGISTWWGLAEATLASVLAVLGFNFYFLPPVGKLTIQDPQNLVAFVNVGLIGFFVSAVALRFVFPSISMEGDNFWIIKALPCTAGQILWEKTLFGSVAVLAKALLLSVAAGLILKTDTPVFCGSVTAAAAARMTAPATGKVHRGNTRT